jgi:hypothetical protein
LKDPRIPSISPDAPFRAIEEMIENVNRLVYEEVDKRLKAMIPVEWRQIVEALEHRVRELQNALETTETICDERTRVLHAIPPCPVHGQNCVPYAVEWVEMRKLERAKRKPRKK